MQTQKQILTDEFQKQADYQKKLSALLNDTSDQSIQSAGEILSKMKDNVYSFETDSGKSDLVSGKVVANLQWSGRWCLFYAAGGRSRNQTSLCSSKS